MKKPCKYDLAKLLFRRQFILGPYYIESLPAWKRFSIRNDICLTVHPDLPVCQVKQENKSITLLGYVLDPYNPQYYDLDILNVLLNKFCLQDNLKSLIQHTYTYGGRWILIVDDGTETILFNDATGYRQVFYTDLSYRRELWCASQPGTIAEVLGLQPDREALEFIDLKKYKHWGKKEYIFPGKCSLFKEIKRLLPNYYLDFRIGSSHRYWPDRYLGNISLEECVSRSSDILRGLIKSAFNRFELALSITAGRDTRLLLAVCREISDSLYIFTNIYWQLDEKSADIMIPSLLLSRLGLRHNIIKCPTKMDHEFAEIYYRNVSAAHHVYGPIAQGMYEHYPQNMICMKGNAIPIVKSNYPKISNRKEVDVRILAKLHRVENSPFANRHYAEWLSDTSEIYNVNIFDLFQWEIKEGSWQAMSQLEMDIAQEVFVPFNCRSLLVDMLSVDEIHRRAPEYELHKTMIANLWPELLEVAINPQQKKKSAIARGIKRVKSGVRSKFKDALFVLNIHKP